MGTESAKLSAGSSNPEDLLVINTERVEQSAGKLQDCCTSLRNAAKSIEGAKADLSSISQSGSGCISSQLKRLSDAQDQFFRNVGMLEGGAYALRNIAITYDNAEKALAGGELRNLVMPAEDKDTSVTGFSEVGGISAESGESDEEESEESSWEWGKRQWTDDDESASWYNAPFDKSGKLEFGQTKAINDPDEGSYKDRETFTWAAGLSIGNYEKSYEPLRDEKTQKAWGEYKTDPKGDAPFAPSKTGTIAEIYAEYSCDWTLAGAQTNRETDYIKYNAEAYVLRAQANVHAGVGAFLYETPEGDIVRAYGLSAQAGASFTLAGASASGDAGSAYAGVMGSASAVAGEVYAKADATIGWVGGKFVAVASGAVGADLLRATAGGGGRLLGVEVAAEASVKVGMSAKFEVGFDGSKFKANIGAALGIGFDINVSIDFSKVGSVIKDIGKVIVNTARAAVDWFRRW